MEVLYTQLSSGEPETIALCFFSQEEQREKEDISTMEKWLKTVDDD